MRSSSWLQLSAVLLAGVAVSGCEVIGDIFQAGMAVGIFIVIAVIALAVYLIGKMRRSI
jgi:hypothetical protein